MRACAGFPGYTWEAVIVLKTAEPEREGSLTKLVGSLAAAARGRHCSCAAKSSHLRRHHTSSSMRARRRMQRGPLETCYAVGLIEADGQSAGTYENPLEQNVIDYCNAWIEGEEGRSCSGIYTVEC
jgi:hypothetical protein